MVAWSFLWFIIVLVSAVLLISGVWVPTIVFLKIYAGFCIITSFLGWMYQIGKH